MEHIRATKSALPENNDLELDVIGAKHSSASAGVFSLRRAHYFNATRSEGVLNNRQQAYTQMPGEAEPDTRQQMIIEHRHLVDEIAKRYINRGITFFDLVKHGESGLFHALDKFELEGGFRFATYASWCIRQTIERALMDQEGQHDQTEFLAVPVSTIGRKKAVRIRNAQLHQQGI